MFLGYCRCKSSFGSHKVRARMTDGQTFPMSWEEAVIWLRKQPNQQELVRACYYDDPLEEAAKRFHASGEWIETHKLLPPPGGKALDVGSGRGISAYALAADGWDVTALEPDKSMLVGAGAILELQRSSGLPIVVVSDWGESLPFKDSCFDLVHCRQVLHHARDLPAFCREAARVLKPGGVFIATREHVVNTADDLDIFFAAHPLHKLYGGENAYPLQHYLSAIGNTGLLFTSILSPFENKINYFPYSNKEIRAVMLRLWPWKREPAHDELVELANQTDTSPGRLYTFIAVKPKDNAISVGSLRGELHSTTKWSMAVRDNLYARLERSDANHKLVEQQLSAINEGLSWLQTGIVSLESEISRLDAKAATQYSALEAHSRIDHPIRHNFRRVINWLKGTRA